MTKKLKALFEKRAALLAQMEKATADAINETRAMTEDEVTAFNELKAQVEALTATIKAIQDAEAAKPVEPAPVATDERGECEPEEDKETDEEKETRAFASYIRATVQGGQSRALTLGDSGAIIGKTIASQIVSKAVEISPILSAGKLFSAKGEVAVPVFENGISVSYKKDFAELTASSSAFTSVVLKPLLIGALTLVDKSLLAESDLDLVAFVVGEMAVSLAAFLDKAFLTGSDAEGEIKGIAASTNVLTAASATAITADELIDLQEKIPDSKRSGAFFVMTTATRSAIRKLKDGDGNYLLNRDATAQWGYSLLGSPVYASDGISGIATGKAAVVYVNPSVGVGVKLTNGFEIEILRELFAAKHAIGVAGWVQGDVEIIDQQACAVLKMA